MKRILFTLAATAVISAAAAVTHYMTQPTDVYDRYRAMVRHNIDRPVIYLIFSADSMFEGAPAALDAMADKGIKGNFFFTGNFLSRPENNAIINRVIDDGHYVGGHSNRHILLADWDRDRTPLVTTDSMIADVQANLEHLANFGINRASAGWFLPPFEWIGPQQADCLRDSLGLEIINPTPAIETYRDYTTPDMAEYKSSDEMIKQLFSHEQAEGLNGSIIIFHLGTQDVRTDKLYNHLPEILDSLSSLGYRFARF